VPISLRYGTASADSAPGALGAALAEYHGEREQFQEYRQTPEDLRALIAEYLHRPLPDDRRLLIVIDALDEAIGWQVARDLFPRAPGRHLRVVASARQLANTTHADWLHQLGWDDEQTTELTLQLLTPPSIADILARMGAPVEDLAANINVLAEIGRVSEGDLLTIRSLVEGLRKGNYHLNG
jgi:hypothetical protein